MSRDNQSVALRALMVREIHSRYPHLSDGRISKLTGIHRDMVRRHRLGMTKARIESPETLRAISEIVARFNELQRLNAHGVTGM